MADAVQNINTKIDSSQLINGGYVHVGKDAVVGDISGARLFINTHDKSKEKANAKLSKLLQNQRAEAEAKDEAFNHNFVLYNQTYGTIELLTREEALNRIEEPTDKPEDDASNTAGKAAIGAGAAVVSGTAGANIYNIFDAHNPGLTVQGDPETQPEEAYTLTATDIENGANPEYQELWKQVDGYDDSIFRGELTENQLIKNTSFQNAAMVLYNDYYDGEDDLTWAEYAAEQEWSKERANEELGKWGIQHMVNVRDQMWTSGHYRQSELEKKSPSVQIALAYATNALEHKNWGDSFGQGAKNIGRSIWSSFTDPVSLGIMGASLLLAIPTGGMSLAGGAGALAMRAGGGKVVSWAGQKAMTKFLTGAVQKNIATKALQNASASVVARLQTNAVGRAVTSKVAVAAGHDAALEGAATGYIRAENTFYAENVAHNTLHKQGVDTFGRAQETFNIADGLKASALDATVGLVLGRTFGGIGQGSIRGPLDAKKYSRDWDEALTIDADINAEKATQDAAEAAAQNIEAEKLAKAEADAAAAKAEQDAAEKLEAEELAAKETEAKTSGTKKTDGQAPDNVTSIFKNSTENTGNDTSNAQPHQNIPQEILDAISRGDSVEYSDPNVSFKIGQNNANTGQNTSGQTSGAQANTTGAPRQTKAATTNSTHKPENFKDIDLPEYNEGNWNYKTSWLRRSWKPHLFFSHPLANPQSALTDPYPMLRKIVGAVDESMQELKLIDSLKQFDEKMLSLSKELATNPSQRDRILSDVNDEMRKFSERNSDELAHFNEQLQKLYSKVESYEVLPENDGRKVGLVHQVEKGVVVFSHKQATLDYLKDLMKISEELQNPDFGDEGKALTGLASMTDTNDIVKALQNNMTRVHELSTGSDFRLNPKGTDTHDRDAILRNLAEGYYNPYSRQTKKSYGKNLEVLWQDLETRYLKYKDKDGKFPEKVFDPYSSNKFAKEFKEFYNKGYEQEGLYLARYLQMRRGDDKIETFPNDLSDQLMKDDRYTTDRHYKKWVDEASGLLDTSEQAGHRLFAGSKGRGPQQFYAEQSYEYRFSTRYGKERDLIKPKTWLATPGWITIMHEGAINPLIKASYFLGAQGTKDAKKGSYVKIVPDWNSGEKLGLKNNPVSRALYRTTLGGITSKPALYTLGIGGTIYGTGLGAGAYGDYLQTESDNPYSNFLGAGLSSFGDGAEWMGEKYLWTAVQVTDKLTPLNYVVGNSIQGAIWDRTLGGVSEEEALEMINDDPRFAGQIDEVKNRAAALIADANDGDEDNIAAHISAARAAYYAEQKAVPVKVDTPVKTDTTQKTKTSGGKGSPVVRDESSSTTFNSIASDGKGVMGSIGGGLSSIFEGAFPNSGISTALSSTFNWVGSTFSQMKNGQIKDGQTWLAYGGAAAAALVIAPWLGAKLGVANFGGIGSLLIAFLVIGYGGKMMKNMMAGQGTGLHTPDFVKDLASQSFSLGSEKQENEADAKPEVKTAVKPFAIANMGDGDVVGLSDQDGDGEKDVVMISENIVGQSKGNIANVPSVLKIVGGAAAANDTHFDSKIADLVSRKRLISTDELGPFAGSENFEDGADNVININGMQYTAHSPDGTLSHKDTVLLAHGPS